MTDEHRARVSAVGSHGAGLFLDGHTLVPVGAGTERGTGTRPKTVGPEDWMP
jgi:hypothetical protein